MEQFASETLASKIWLTKNKCDSLKDSQKELLSCVDALEARVQGIKVSTEPITEQKAVLEKLISLRKQLASTDQLLAASLRNLGAIEQGMDNPVK